jgi:RHS repeat-associated protein
LFAYNLRLPGQYFDAETGKHYNYFRDYDPAIGRYVESDPIGLKGGLNSYRYASASPIKLSDARGLLVLSGKCEARRGQIERAEQEVRKKLQGSCGTCSAGNDGGCVPCQHVERLKNLLDTTPVDCPDSNIAPNTSPAVTACGWQLQTGIGITPIGFRPSGPEGYCGCLESILYHELLHFVVGGNDAHPEIYGMERTCFKCGVGQFNFERGSQ